MKALRIVPFILLGIIAIWFTVGEIALAKEFKSVLPQAQLVQWNGADGRGYSDGDDSLLAKYSQAGDTTGFPALDNGLRFLWNNCGTLMLVFGLLAGISILAVRQGGESHNDQMRREAEELEQPGLSEDIHDPFDAPEGMQPTSQYVSVRSKNG